MGSEGDKDMRLINGLSMLAITMVYGCKKPYILKVVSGKTNYLVVEGIINTANDSTIFKTTTRLLEIV